MKLIKTLNRKADEAAWTLIELLVVITGIAGLIALVGLIYVVIHFIAKVW